MTKKLIAIILVAVLLVSAVPQKSQSHIILQGLAYLAKFLLSYAAAKGLDRILFGQQLADVKSTITLEEENIQNSVSGSEREELLRAYRQTMNIIDDLERRVANNENSIEELKKYFRAIHDDSVKPLEKKVNSLELRVNSLEAGLDSTNSVVEQVQGDVAYLGQEVDETNREVAKVKVDVNDLGREVDETNREVAKVKVDVNDVVHDVKSMKTKILFSAVGGLYYRGFRYRLDEWGDRYTFLPFTMDSSRVFHGAEASLGFWINKMIYLEGAYHFVPEYIDKVYTDSEEYDYELAVEGGGWSAIAMLTFPTTKTLYLEIGAGIVGNSYKITYTALEKHTDTVVEENLHRTNKQDFVCIAGLRLGENGIYGIGEAEFLYDGMDYRGLYFRFGLQKTL